jgi:tRNA uridine 5-carboxymethylaminomethyl modification enzyme
MFTSRAEYRLLLRQDNADSRLCRFGYEMGLLPERHYRKFERKQKAIDTELERLQKTRAGSETLVQLLRRPEIHYKDLPGADAKLAEEVIQRVEIEVKYAGYIERQQSEIEKFKNLEGKCIPATFDYSSVPSLCQEARLRLTQIRPATVGQASRISGVSPADISILMVWLKRAAQMNVEELSTNPENTDNPVLETGEPE